MLGVFNLFNNQPLLQSLFIKIVSMSDATITSPTEAMLGYDMGSVIHGEGAVTNLDFHR